MLAGQTDRPTDRPTEKTLKKIRKIRYVFDLVCIRSDGSALILTATFLPSSQRNKKMKKKREN